MSGVLLLLGLALNASAALPEERVRLGRAAAVLGKLAESGRSFGRGHDTHPTFGQIAEYAGAKPWAPTRWGDLPRGAWPAEAQAPALRLLLADRDPAIRGLAVEALAALARPEDVPRLAALLSDQAAALPWLEPLPYAIHYPSAPKILNNPVPWLVWRTGSIGDAAARGLLSITEVDFRRQPFAPWWKENGNARRRLWYWTGRARRLLNGGDEKQRAEARQRLREELRSVDPLTEARIRLRIETYEHGLEEPPPADSLFAGPAALRLDEKALLALLESDEVYWHRLLSGASPVVKRRNLGRLRSLLARTADWKGRGALIVAISRLVSHQERDSLLRKAMLREKDEFTREEAATELVRSALASNEEFLEREFFQAGAQPMQAILRELGAAPLTPVKRRFLVSLVLDPRFESYWTRPNRSMGDDMWRKYAICSLNAHAGFELITSQTTEEYALTDPKTSGPALASVLAKVRSLK